MTYLNRCLKAKVPLPATTVADVLQASAYSLVADSVLNPGTRHLKPDERLQHHLRSVVRILRAASPGFRSLSDTVHWYRAAPLARFGNKTAHALALAGRADELVEWIEAEVPKAPGDLAAAHPG